MTLLANLVMEGSKKSKLTELKEHIQACGMGLVSLCGHF